jgi:hypothetical protein
MLYVDMERGLYRHQGKQPRNGDGSYRVVKKLILRECGITEEYGQAAAKIWNNPQFTDLVEKERRRRDIGVADALDVLDQEVTGPLTKMGEDIITKVADIFSREPDKEDPTALSPAEYVRLGREWFHEALEVEGKVGAEKQKGIETVMAQLYKGQQVTDTMLKGALELVREYRELQDRKMANVIDG